MNDLISRQDAKDVVDMELDAIDHVPEWVYDRLLTALDKVPSAQPKSKQQNKQQATVSSDCVSRQAAIDEISKQQTYKMFEGEDTVYFDANDVGSVLVSLPSAQPSQIHCYECKHYDTQECMGRNAFYGLKDDDYCSWAELRGEQDE